MSATQQPLTIGGLTNTSNTTPSATVLSGGSVEHDKIYQWINELLSSETRENALLELSKKREVVPDLAIMLWH